MGEYGRIKNQSGESQRIWNRARVAEWTAVDRSSSFDLEIRIRNRTGLKVVRFTPMRGFQILLCDVLPHRFKVISRSTPLQVTILGSEGTAISALQIYPRLRGKFQCNARQIERGIVPVLDLNFNFLSF